jgi:hypothetical protein
MVNSKPSATASHKDKTRENHIGILDMNVLRGTRIPATSIWSAWLLGVAPNMIEAEESPLGIVEDI